MTRDYSNYQKKIIKRFYDNREGIDSQRLSEIASDLYLAEGKKKDRLWSVQFLGCAPAWSSLLNSSVSA